MAKGLISAEKLKETCKNFIDRMCSSLGEIDNLIFKEICKLRKTIGNLTEQSVSVNRAIISKDFLEEFPEVDVKNKIIVKIYNCLEEEILKLNSLLDEVKVKIDQHRSMIVPLEAFNLDSLDRKTEDCAVNLFNVCEWSRDCVQILTTIHLNLEISVANINYDDLDSLKLLDATIAESKSLRKSIDDKQKAILDILKSTSSEEIKLTVISKS